MKQNQWFAVRCCCTPKKVFGFIKMESPGMDGRIPIYRDIKDIMGQRHQIKLMSIYVNKLYPTSCLGYDAGVPIEVSEHTPPEIAIYSDDRPIEFWRTIEGFVEAHSED
jgi:hypothetical protein